MKLRSLNKYLSLLIIVTLFLPLQAEDEINIWNKEKKDIQATNKIEQINSKQKINIKELSEEDNLSKIKDEILKSSTDIKIFGIYDPAENDFNLNMWSETRADDVRSSINRINKIKLSKISKEIFEKTLFSFAYPPKEMSDKEFIDIKINWMISNERLDLIEKFLKQNIVFHNKKKIIQYLVDQNIATANIKKSCEKINFMDKSIKDSYLEKFKIYCLVFKNKKNEAQLLYDILKEQNLSDDFFDDKINFLLGITNKTSNKIKEDNLLNFYLSSITIKDFKFEPVQNTKKIIWNYLNAANLIQLEDVTNKEKLKNLEIAANEGQLNKQKIFNIYKKIPFDINTLINAENIYQTFDSSDSRALIYQKFLLSDSEEAKIKNLFLLEELFKQDKLLKVYAEFFNNRLKEIDLESISSSYQEVVKKKILSEDEFNLGKIKYDDKILHRSKLIKFYTEKQNKNKIQKDLNKVLKKIKKNKKYFYSAKDLALIHSMASDGLKIPKELNYQELLGKYDVPENLLQLATSSQSAFLTLKIVEIIGEDEPHQLDAETIYFITYLLNQINLKKIRNEVLISALPLRS